MSTFECVSLAKLALTRWRAMPIQFRDWYFQDLGVQVYTW